MSYESTILNVMYYACFVDLHLMITIIENDF